MSKYQKTITAILCIFHAVGILGLLWSETREFLIPLSPWIIFVSFILSLLFQKPFSFKLILLLLAIGISGFFIEYAGVTTGWIFGSYFYGNALGFAWKGIPLVIGITWCSLTYYTAQFKLEGTNQLWFTALFSAALMTAYDFFLEPSAIRFSFWTWENDTVPLQNYLAWFVISLIFQWVLRKSGVPFKNKFAGTIYLIQLVFFACLAILPRLF